MGTKENPGKYDYYTRALPDEPMFTLLARDPDFARLVKKWSKRRLRDILSGERPKDDMSLVIEANQCADAGEKWRRENYGKWRNG